MNRNRYRLQPPCTFNWIHILVQTDDPRHLVAGFVNSLEYRGEFGP